MKALVYKSTGNFYLAKDKLGIFHQCRVRGKLKIDQRISTTNPVAVGDWVTLSEDRDLENVRRIIAIDDRGNYIIREAVHKTFRRHIIAANMDLAVLVVTVKKPFTSQGFIDRFLVTAEAYHIPALVVFNKSDLHTGNTYLAWKKKNIIFKNAGYQTLSVSAKTGQGLEQLKTCFKDKTTLLTGHSGVGKSTLINHLIPNLNLKTTSLSEKEEKGRHTTTYAQMFDNSFGGRIIDTPGIKELGLIDIEKAELSHYFPEMAQRISNCKFNNCIHFKEPQCAVKAAVEKGKISIERYESYLSLLHSIKEDDYR